MIKRRGHGEGSIHKRADGRWVGVIDLGWREGKRKRKYVYAATQDELIARLRKAQQAIASGLPAPDDRRKTGAFLDWWATTVLPGTVSEGSEDSYKRAIRLYLKPSLGNVPLVKLTPGHVTAMLQGMAERGLSPATQSQARKVLRRALRRAMQEEYVHRNVAAIADGPKMVRAERRSLTPEQARKFLKHIKGDRQEAALVLALALGVRRGEVLGISWDDLDLEAKPPTVTLRRQLQRRPGRGLVLGALKTVRSRRTLVLPPQVVDLLRAGRKAQATERLAAGPLWADTERLVFTTPLGAPVDPDNFRHRVGKLTDDAGLGPWTTHELRHSAGSLLFAVGVPMKVISETLGHSSERVTSEVYVHLMAQHRALASSAMTEALWGA